MKARFGLGVVRATPQRLLPSLLGPERPDSEVFASGATTMRGDRQVAKLCRDHQVAKLDAHRCDTLGLSEAAASCQTTQSGQ